MHRSAIGFITITLCLLALVAHGLAGKKEAKPMSLSMTSSAFADNGPIPQTPATARTSHRHWPGPEFPRKRKAWPSSSTTLTPPIRQRRK